jgi:LPS export ABC transporter protein LptC
VNDRALVALLIVAVAVGACQKTEGPPVGVKPGALADSADQVMYGARFAITDRGLRRADINGDTAYFFNDNTRLVLRPLRGQFYSSSGALDGIITARQGVYDTRQANLIATGDVVVTTIDSKRLTTPYLKYDQRINQISSDSAFTMSEPGRDMRGVGFTSDADLTTFRVTRVISAKAGSVAVPK